MAGRVAVLAILGAALIGGAGMFYLQVWHFYEDVDPAADPLTLGAPGEQAALEVVSFEGIDAGSSPIRYRACAEIADPEAVLALAEPAAGAVPTNAPFWFGCFDAAAIGADIEAGRAAPIVLRRDLRPGVDRVGALYPDGRLLAWHQLNELYDDTRRID